MKDLSKAVPAAPVGAEKQLRHFVEKFEPRYQVLIRAVRKSLRKRFPTAYELAYSNYNFFVIGYSPSQTSPYSTRSSLSPPGRTG